MFLSENREIPHELRQGGAMVHVDLEDHRNEEFTKAVVKSKPFSGKGHTLGSPAPTVVSTPVTPTGSAPTISSATAEQRWVEFDWGFLGTFDSDALVRLAHLAKSTKVLRQKLWLNCQPVRKLRNRFLVSQSKNPFQRQRTIDCHCRSAFDHDPGTFSRWNSFIRPLQPYAHGVWYQTIHSNVSTEFHSFFRCCCWRGHWHYCFETHRARPQYASASFALLTTFPSKELTDETQTIESAGLLSASILQRLQ